jgi:protein-disulfide isomerase
MVASSTSARVADGPRRRYAARRGGVGRPGEAPSIRTITLFASALGLLAATLLIARPALPAVDAEGGSPAASTAAGVFAPRQPAYLIPADVQTTVGATLGSPMAPVTLEVYSDFQCPVCGRFARDWVPRLIREFVTPGQLRIVYRDLAFLGRGNDPDESLDAAVAASCAGRNGKFWTYWAFLFANQQGENQGAFAPDRLKGLAEASGTAAPDWQACVTGRSAHSGVVQATTKAVSIGIRATPTLVINGRTFEGLVPYDQIAAAIVSAGAAPPAPAGGSGAP